MEKFPLIDTMRRSLEGKTVVVVDHDIVWQSRFCDNFCVLNDGKIIQSGTAEELLAQDGLFKELYEEASGAASAPKQEDLQPSGGMPHPGSGMAPGMGMPPPGMGMPPM